MKSIKRTRKITIDALSLKHVSNYFFRTKINLIYKYFVEIKAKILIIHLKLIYLI